MPALSTSTRHGGVAQSFHWLTVLAVGAAYLFSVGGPEGRVYSDTGAARLQLHETLGMIVFVLVCLRPTLGSLLGLAMPPAWMSNRIVRWTFFRGTNAWFERAWKSGPPFSALPRWAYVFDVLYYGFGTLVLPGLALASFIMLVGHPGSFGGAGALARW